jgi:hypothetical protein
MAEDFAAAAEENETPDGFREVASWDATVAPNLAVDGRQLDQIAIRLWRQRGKRPTSRAVFDHVVRNHLPTLVGELRELGFLGGELPRRRPRRMAQSTWNALLAASAECGLAASDLLRALVRFELEAGSSASEEKAKD